MGTLVVIAGSNWEVSCDRGVSMGRVPLVVLVVCARACAGVVGPFTTIKLLDAEPKVGLGPANSETLS